MKKYTIRILIALNISILAIALYSNISWAGIGVEPSVTEIEVAPNTEKTGFFTVVNGDNSPASVKIEPEDWLKIRTGNSPLSPDKWLVTDEKEFTIEPAGSKKISYRINVPENVKGELIAQVFFASAAPSGGNLNITSRFGVALYVGIEGTEIIAPVIKEIKPSKKAISITVENRGNVHLRPSGTVTIKDSNGNVKQKIDIPYTAVIFGEQEHSYAVSVDEKTFSRGKYTIEADFNIGTVYGKSAPFGKTISFYTR